MANCHRPGRRRAHARARRAGWDVEQPGSLRRSAGVRVLVPGGAPRHGRPAPLRYLGLGDARRWSPPTTRAGSSSMRSPRRSRPVTGPTIVCLQAGNLHSGGVRPASARRSALAHEHGAWVHVDGAFGLWAGRVPGCGTWSRATRPPTRGPRTRTRRSTSRTTAASRSSRTRGAARPVACTRLPDPATLRPGDPLDRVPEMSRRAARCHGVGGAALPRPLGRGRPRRRHGRPRRRRSPPGSPTIPGAEVLNEVVFTQVSRPSAPTNVRARSWHACSRTARRGCPGRAGTAATSCGCRSATGRPPRVTFVAACARSREPRAASSVPNRVDAAPSVD